MTLELPSLVDELVKTSHHFEYAKDFVMSDFSLSDSAILQFTKAKRSISKGHKYGQVKRGNVREEYWEEPRGN